MSKENSQAPPTINVHFGPTKTATFTIPVGSQLTATDLKSAYESTVFTTWLNNMNESKTFDVQNIELQSIDYFGSRVGFLKIKTDAKRNGIPVPGIIFLRGGSVGILTILVNKGREYALLTTQARVPVGRVFTEIPAGMLDDNGSFKGVAANEMHEETGIDITDNKLIDLTQLAYDGKYPGIFPSPGGCDEFIRLFVYREEVTDEKLVEFNGKCTGNLDENEVITLKVIPLENLWKETSDVKALSCLHLYHQLKREGKIEAKIETKKEAKITSPSTRPTENGGRKASGLEVNTKFDVPNKDIQITILDSEHLKGPETILFIIETVYKGTRKLVVRRHTDFRALDFELKKINPNPKLALQDFTKSDSPKPGNRNLINKTALQEYIQEITRTIPNILSDKMFLEFFGITNIEK